MSRKNILPNKPGDLPLDIKTDKCGMIAQNLVTTIEKLDELTEKKGALCDDLYKALVRSKRTTIQVAGMTFERQHKGPQNKIVIKKAK